MRSRSGPIAPVLGILLLLIGLGSFGFYVWGIAPMEEPASPGRTPNPSKMAEDKWWLRHPDLIPRLHQFSIPMGVLFAAAGVVLLLPLDSRRD